MIGELVIKSSYIQPLDSAVIPVDPRQSARDPREPLAIPQVRKPTKARHIT